MSVEALAKTNNFSFTGKKDFVLRSQTGAEVHFSVRHQNVEGTFGGVHWSETLSARPEFIKEKRRPVLCVPLDFGDRALTPLLTGKLPRKWDQHLAYERYAQVVIDPGHGGNDWGAAGASAAKPIYEKNLTLEFAQELNRAFTAVGITSALTRNQDDYVALNERYQVANTLHPKLFLSLHMNAKGQTPGFELFTLSTFRRDRKSLVAIAKKTSADQEPGLMTFRSAAKQEVSVEWATRLREVLSNFRPPVSAGMRRVPFFLLYAVDRPALLIELGYLDRDEDLKFWLNSAERLKVWSALVDSVKKQFEKP